MDNNLLNGRITVVLNGWSSPFFSRKRECTQVISVHEHKGILNVQT